MKTLPKLENSSRRIRDGAQGTLSPLDSAKFETVRGSWTAFGKHSDSAAVLVGSLAWRKSCLRCWGNLVRYQQIPFETFKATLTGSGMSEAMAQGMLDMMVAKNEGLDNAERRTPQSTTATSFRQWCKEVLKPAVLS
jgi:hypothetical protein